MKNKLCILFLAIFLPFIGLAGSIRVSVDERVELLAIIFRLAESDEYVHNQSDAKYAQDVDSYFATYKNHPAVQMAIKLRKKNNIGYNAVMDLAIHLSNDGQLKPLMDFKLAKYDSRWDAESATQFSKLVKQFYDDSHFSDFYKSQSDFYQLGVQRLDSVMSDAHFEWFDSFYGMGKQKNKTIVFSPANGINNYGCQVKYPDGREDIYGIVGAAISNTPGNPTFNAMSIELVIHEFNHSYINPLVDQYASQFENSVPKVFKTVKEQMKAKAYGSWKIMLYESLVRTGEIRYLAQYNPERSQKKIKEEKMNGFIWIDKLDSTLNAYEQNRSTYPSLESYVSQIAATYQQVSLNAPQMVNDYKARSPKFIGFKTLKINKIEANLTEITLVFDKPMNGKIAINYGKGGEAAFPITGLVGWNEEKTELTLKVALKEKTDYNFYLGQSFETKDGYPLPTTLVEFKTL